MNRNLKFANPIDWDINNSYYLNEIVFRNNDAYTAKTNVPSGISIENTDYWEKTSDKDWIAGAGPAIVGEAVIRS